jgi:hypothetical protein
MDTFYIIVLSVAVCLLILLLTFIGIKMAYNRRSSTDEKNRFPPKYSTCPDHWTADTDGKCTPSGSLNVGSFTGLSININDSDWGTAGVTKSCALKKWAAKNDISWDGISNFNACPS